MLLARGSFYLGSRCRLAMVPLQSYLSGAWIASTKSPSLGAWCQVGVLGVTQPVSTLQLAVDAKFCGYMYSLPVK